MPETLPSQTTPSRTLSKQLLLWLRRAHLYFGLLLFPWAVLYGITGYLFNHPTHFADAPIKRFNRSLFSGTPMADWPSPNQIAEEVVKKLNDRDGSGNRYQLDTTVAPKFSNEFIFGRQDRQSSTLSFLVNVAGSGGTIRIQPNSPLPSTNSTPPPFAIPAPTPPVASPPPASPPPSTPSGLASDKLELEQDLQQIVADTMREILPKLGEPDSGNIVVTSIPDFILSVRDGDIVWQARYNVMRGTIGGQLATTVPIKRMSMREYLLRLHTAHGFPDERNSVWLWAVIVDLMSFVLIGWAATGLFMWWQIKATRTWGFVAIGVGSFTAVAMGWAMWQSMQ
jgi:hypothetical protein